MTFTCLYKGNWDIQYVSKGNIYDCTNPERNQRIEKWKLNKLQGTSQGKVPCATPQSDIEFNRFYFYMIWSISLALFSTVKRQYFKMKMIISQNELFSLQISYRSHSYFIKCPKNRSFMLSFANYIQTSLMSFVSFYNL